MQDRYLTVYSLNLKPVSNLQVNAMKKEHFIIKYRWWIIILTLLIVSASVIPLTRVSINPDLESYLPDTIAPKVNTDKIAEIFGDNEMMILVFESDDVLNPSTLARIRDLSREFNKMSEFDNVMSLFDTKSIKGEEGIMVVEPVIQAIPQSEAGKGSTPQGYKSQ